MDVFLKSVTHVFVSLQVSHTWREFEGDPVCSVFIVSLHKVRRVRLGKWEVYCFDLRFCSDFWPDSKSRVVTLKFCLRFKRFRTMVQESGWGRIDTLKVSHWSGGLGNQQSIDIVFVTMDETCNNTLNEIDLIIYIFIVRVTRTVGFTNNLDFSHRVLCRSFSIFRWTSK